MTMRFLLADRRGAIAPIFGLTLLPILAAAGSAVDYGRLTNARTQVQAASDRAAVAVAASDDGNVGPAILERTREALRRDMPGLTGLSVTGSWVDAANFQVQINGSLTMTIVSAVPGMPSSVPLALTTIANRIPPKYKTLPPKTSLLEPEAADYNRAYLYCYTPTWRTKDPNDPTKGRRDFVPIADNASPPTDFEKEYKKDKKAYKLPECESGEVPAYMMRNVRNARGDKKRWDTDKDYYEYFTDTELDPNTNVMINRYVGEQIDSNGKRSAVNLTNRPMLETILCASESECKPRDQGGILPTRTTQRDPATATGACGPGKLMYYGFEDRPGGDRDYDDIRLVVSCPEVVKIQDKQVRIVK
jgi:Flp pilus assembly protein TadG